MANVGVPLADVLPPGATTVTLPDSTSLLLSTGLLGESRVLRKLLGSKDPVVHDPDVALALLRLAAVPVNVRELEAWLDAADMLCADVSAPVFLQTLLSSFAAFLGPSRPLADVLTDIDGTGRDGAARINLRAFLVDGLSAELAAPQRGDNPDPGRPSSLPRPPATGELTSHPLRVRQVSSSRDASHVHLKQQVAAALTACQTAWALIGGRTAAAPHGAQVWDECGAVVRSVVLGAADTIAGSRAVLACLPALR